MQIDLLQEYIFVVLDIFKENLHNRGISKDNRLEAWLTFLCEDSPEWILKLIEAYPAFERLYQEVYKICRNTEVMIGLFSEELLELDKNTVEFMIDEMQDAIDKLRAQRDEAQVQLDETQTQLDEAYAQNIDLKAQLAQKDILIAELMAAQTKK